MKNYLKNENDGHILNDITRQSFVNSLRQLYSEQLDENNKLDENNLDW